MSAKGRRPKAQHGEGENENEFYVTPYATTFSIVPFVGAATTVCDLGCGSGAIADVIRDRFPRTHATGFELDRGRAVEARARKSTRHDHRVFDEVYDGDVLSPLFPLPEIVQHEECFDLVISNPPFSLAVDFLDVALRLVRPGGVVAFLLRDSWIVPTIRAGVSDRCDLFRLRQRPFPDACEYAWHVWRPSDPMHGGRWCVV